MSSNLGPKTGFEIKNRTRAVYSYIIITVNLKLMLFLTTSPHNSYFSVKLRENTLKILYEKLRNTELKCKTVFITIKRKLLTISSKEVPRIIEFV